MISGRFCFCDIDRCSQAYSHVFDSNADIYNNHYIYRSYHIRAGKGAADVGDFQYNIIQAAQITSISIIPYLIYPYVLIVFIAAQIIREK